MREQTREDISVPPSLAAAALALILFTFAAVLIGRATETGLVTIPPAEPVERRMLEFYGEEGQTLEVREAVSGQMVALLSAGQDGFIRGVLRALSRDRVVTRTTGEDVYLLTRWDDGRLTIEDTATGARFGLNSFGVDNLESFARLLASRENAP